MNLFGWEFSIKAADLPVEPPPKVRAGSLSTPSIYRTATPDNEKSFKPTERSTANTDLTTFRTGASTKKTLRNFAKVNPDMSASVDAYLRTAITAGYKAVAKNRDGTFNKDATKLLQQLLTRFDVLPDYSQGFGGILSIRSIAEMLAKDLRIDGACALELVLDKAKLPYALQPVAVSTIEFKPDPGSRWLRPFQVMSGKPEVNLDVPTFFYVGLDQDLIEPYPDAPMEAALQPILAAQAFVNDLRRVVQRAIHPRQVVTLDAEKLRAAMPQELMGDNEEAQKWVDSVISSVASRLNQLKPEDALVLLDTMTLEYLGGGNSDLSSEYSTLTVIFDAKVATGTKTLPAILGHGSGSQNIASTETMLFMKNAEGAVQFKLNEIFSRALTLAVRLFALDVVVEFAFDRIDLRPETELEAFKSMRQSRVLELLSLGLLSDEAAALELTGQLPPDGAPKLSGTMFKGGATPSTNPYSNTSQGQGSALNQNLTPDTPTDKRGKPAKGS